MVVEDGVDIDMAEPRWIQQIFERNHLGRADGRSLIVTKDHRPNLFTALAGCGQNGRAKEEADVDVKDLLELGRIIIEKGTLDSILREHSSDLHRTVATAVY